MKITVALASDDQRYARYLRAVKGTEVEEADYRGTRMDIDGHEWPMHILPRPPAGVDTQTGAQMLAAMIRVGEIGMVVAGQVPQREREALEAVGVAWCDGRGALHIDEGGLYVHIDVAAKRQIDREETTLGLAGIRALQVLLSDPAGDWTLTRLQSEAAISLGQAHNVFKLLERQRLVQTDGRGPLQRRVITDYRAALDWLAAVDQRRRRAAIAGGYLYGRNTREVLHQFAERADRHGVPYAFTAAAGAELLRSPVLTRIETVQARVGFFTPDDAVHLLELEPATGASGANVEVWADTGELGTFGAENIGGLNVAPPIRVWLDLARQGGRSADAAQLFREQTLERI